MAPILGPFNSEYMNLTKKQAALIARLDKAAAKDANRGRYTGFYTITVGKNPHLTPGMYSVWTDAYIMRLESMNDTTPVYEEAPSFYPDITKLLNTPKEDGVSYKIKWDTLTDALALSSSENVTVTDAGLFVLLASDDRKTFVLVAKVRG
jgi:hypothetical protein